MWIRVEAVEALKVKSMKSERQLRRTGKFRVSVGGIGRRPSTVSGHRPAFDHVLDKLILVLIPLACLTPRFPSLTLNPQKLMANVHRIMNPKPGGSCPLNVDQLLSKSGA